ncbi:MAG: AsmA family protein [Mediterranea sp.]|jgi:hypothetical protein|nr:AsmA family protein [Mediterranea sp.]
MKKGLKITGIVVVAIIVLMAVLPLAFQGKIAGIVKSEGNKMLNGQFDFKSLDISLFRNFPKASITLEDFWLKGAGDFENDTLVQAGGVTAAINLFSLFGDSYDVSKIGISDAKIHAIVLPDGRVNWDIMKVDSTETSAATDTTAASAFNVKLQNVTVSRMDLVYDDRQGNMYADMRGLDANCSGDFSADHTTLKLDAETQSLTYRMNGIPFLANANIAAKMDVDADLANNKYTLKDNTLRLNAIEAGIDGWVAMRDPAIDMDLKLNTNDVGFKEILSLIPAIYSTEFASLKTDGTATLTASAKGTLQGDTVPAFDVDMQVKNAMFRYPSLPAGVDQINISANVRNPGGSADQTVIDINPFTFRLAGNPFGMTANVKTPVSDPEFTLGAKGTLDLGQVKQVYPLQDMELNGVVNANMQVAGRMSYIEKELYDRVQASGTVALSGMKLKMKDMPDVDIQKSLLTFTPQYLQLSQTTVNIGKNDLTADSRFENYIGYALKGTTLKGNLNVSSNYFDLSDVMGTDSAATATAANDTVAATGLVTVPKNINFAMNADMKKVLFDKMEFDDMKGRLVIADGKVDMQNLSMNTMGGNVVANGYYSTANERKPELNAAFKLADIGFAQAYKELDMVQKMAPIFEGLKGTFSGNMSVQTDLDGTMSPVLPTLQGSGSLNTTDLSLSGVKAIDGIADALKQPGLKDLKAKDMKLDFTIKDGRVATKPFDIKMGDYTLNLSGTTGLDQTIDYSGKVKLPAAISSSAKLSTVDLKIGGSFTSPKVSLDTKSMANEALQMVTEEAASKIGQKLGLDSTVTANKDSLKEKVKEKAKEKALDFLKKKLQ